MKGQKLLKWETIDRIKPLHEKEKTKLTLYIDHRVVKRVFEERNQIVIIGFPEQLCVD